MFNNVCSFLFLQHVSLFGVSFGDVCSRPASAMKVIFRSLLQMPLCGRRCDGTQTNKHKLCYHHAGSSKHDNLETLLVERMKYKTKHAHILQHHVCLKLKIIKLFTSRVRSLNKTSLKQQEALKRVSAIPYLLSTTIPWSQSSPKRQRFPKNGQIALLPKGHVFLFATFLVHFLSSLFHIILQLSLHVIAIFITTKWFHKWFYKSFKKTKAHPFWTFFNDTMLNKKKTSLWAWCPHGELQLWRVQLRTFRLG